MPTLIEMRLKATWQLREDTRQLHGLACALFEGEGAGHSGQFSVWPLRPAAGGSADEWAWRVAWLPDGPVPSAAAAADALRVGHVSCAVTESMQRRVTHAQLAGGPAVSEVAVSFGSPTYFSRNGTGTVLPDPRLIAGSWRRRWNSSLPEEDPLVIGDEAWQDTHRALELAAFDLCTERRDTGHGRERAGFTGTATLRLDRTAPRSARAILGTLARFAEYCGTGAQTTHGFGATRMAPAGG
ncbi:MAG TPA: CRISPR system precrRNA processing endoribonuclease RAMP protein Cas6 [Streptosporangiaceae bacterium]|nr:CRISPR system precrRNA processing endoribonuclease RAMP protein Cas6 [Streptosporangiaceae bacterium]